MKTRRQTGPKWLSSRSASLLCFPWIFLFLCHCQSYENDDPNQVKKGWTRTVKSTRSSDYKISGVNDNELPSSAETNESLERMASSLKNERVVKNSKGEVVRVVPREDLYKDLISDSAREGNKEFRGVKDATTKESRFAHKEFKTPEYLRHQEFAGVKAFPEADAEAHEAGQENRLASKLFQTKTDKASGEKARENGASSRQGNKVFKTSDDRLATRAVEQAVIPKGVSGTSGYRPNVEMSMDDVKKLVNPESSASSR